MEDGSERMKSKKKFQRSASVGREATDIENLANVLVERFNSMRKIMGEEKLRQIVSGTKASTEMMDPGIPMKEQEKTRAAYDLAVRKLFPQQFHH